jgi:FkbM family methyltransferase
MGAIGAFRSLIRHIGFDVVRAPRPWAPFQRLIEDLKINLVLDVGGNEGQYASLLRSAGYLGNIFSFEPASAPFAKLVANSRGDRHWMVERCAVGSEVGTMRLNLSSNSLLNSFRAVDRDFARDNNWANLDAGSEVVQVRTLDQILSTIEHGGAKILLKIDVQGFEDEVLKGAANSFLQFCAIQMEMPLRRTYVGQADIHELTEHLREEGFELSHLCNGSHDVKGRLIEVDGFFIRRDLI